MGLQKRCKCTPVSNIRFHYP